MPRRFRVRSTARSVPTNRQPTNRRKPDGPNPSGLHFLRSRAVARELVRAVGLGPDSLVLEFGAGAGALTEVLAGTGARVLAIERDEAFCRLLQRRFSQQSVRIVHGDLRTVPLPRRPYSVVANIPFSASTTLFRRLLGASDSRLRSAELLTEWGFAKRVSAACPRDLELAEWAARFDITLAGRVAAGAFQPRPGVAAARLSIRRVNGLGAPAERTLSAVLRAVYAGPEHTAGTVVKAVGPGRGAHRLLNACGIDPQAPAGGVPVTTWRTVANQLAASRG